MKKFINSALLLLFVQQLSALSFYDQLCTFNFNWKKYELLAPAGDAHHFTSDKQYIQAHLGVVLSVLRSNPVEQLNPQQYASRMHLIEVLDTYRAAGIFPKNYYRNDRLPVFIDDHKTHCAVGFLLKETGHEDIALRIAAANNYAWLKDIHDPELPAWQAASGFSMEELKLIQGAYFSYREDAFIAVDRYEIPQKPVVKTAYFENEPLHRPMDAKPENVWIKGEGVNGVLNGKWVQNCSPGMPWIVGYYENGKRTGQWEEYFQGTKQLCRNENWRDDKLNGLRRRFDKYGNVIEEIMFKDGNAVTKTNFSLNDSLTYIRKPIDSTLVYTQVFNYEGSLIAAGHEKIYNPGNLLWFQNIELTALNYASVSARGMSTADNVNTNSAGYFENYYNPGSKNIFNTLPLVQYHKQGDWVYYKEYNYSAKKQPTQWHEKIVFNYKHFGQSIVNSLTLFSEEQLTASYDSIHVEYVNNNLKNFYGYGKANYTHLYISYYDENKAQQDLHANYLYGYRPQHYVAPLIVKECGQYNINHEKIGTWKHYNRYQKLDKTENYLVAWKEEEEIAKSK
jgi:hypothetical protein